MDDIRKGDIRLPLVNRSTNQKGRIPHTAERYRTSAEELFGVFFNLPNHLSVESSNTENNNDTFAQDDSGSWQSNSKARLTKRQIKRRSDIDKIINTLMQTFKIQVKSPFADWLCSLNLAEKLDFVINEILMIETDPLDLINDLTGGSISNAFMATLFKDIEDGKIMHSVLAEIEKYGLNVIAVYALQIVLKLVSKTICDELKPDWVKQVNGFAELCEAKNIRALVNRRNKIEAGIEESDSDDEQISHVAKTLAEENEEIEERHANTRAHVGFSDIDSSSNKYRGRACTPGSSMSDTPSHDSDIWKPDLD